MNDVSKITPYSDGKKRRMKMTKLTAVALTTHGANQEANVTFFKSRKGKVEKSGDLVPLVTSEEEGHQHGIRVEIYDNELYVNVMYAESPDAPYSHYHILVRDADGSYTVSTNAGHSHEIDSAVLNDYLLGILNKEEIQDTITKSQADLLTAVNIDGITENLEDDMSKELEQALADANTTIAKLKTDLAFANTVLSFTSTAKTYFNTLGVADQKAFVKANDADRVAVMDMAKAANPVVYTSVADGTEFRKSDGDAMVNMAKRIDAQNVKLGKQDALVKHGTLVKRATDEMGNMTGEDVTKIALITAIEAIEDEETKKAVGAMIKASNSVAKVALETHGTEEPAETKKAAESLDAMAKTYADEHKVSETDAFVKVLETEAGQKLYNEING